jgi:hypothetical protein
MAPSLPWRATAAVDPEGSYVVTITRLPLRRHTPHPGSHAGHMADRAPTRPQRRAGRLLAQGRSDPQDVLDHLSLGVHRQPPRLRPLRRPHQGDQLRPIPSRTVGFTGDTAVQALSEGTYRTEIKPGWDIGGNANGGYLLSIAVRAMIDPARRPDPVSVTGHYLRPGRPAAAIVNTEVVKQGRRFTTATGALAAEGNLLLQVLGTFGDVSTPLGPERLHSTPDGCAAPLSPASSQAASWKRTAKSGTRPDASSRKAANSLSSPTADGLRAPIGLAADRHGVIEATPVSTMYATLFATATMC